MDFRFRYLDQAGVEIEVQSLERLRALVQDGTVGELTLLYDALTREWAPARAHAVYRLVRDEGRPREAVPLPPPPPSIMDKRRTRARAPESPSEPERPSDDSLGMTLTFSLEEPAGEPDPEEAAREILRARERENDRPARDGGFTVWSPSSPGAFAPAPEPAPQPSSPPAPKPLPSRPTGGGRPLAFASTVPDGVKRAPLPDWMETPRATITLSVPRPRLAWWERIHGWLHDIGTVLIESLGPRTLPSTLVLIGLTGLLLLLLGTVRRSDASEGTMTQAAALGPDVSRLVTSLGTARASGFHSMVAGVDSLRRVHTILEVPPIWLEGKYLADAPHYPEVKDFWTRYQAFLADVRANDTALYRAGLVQKMDEEGIDATTLTLRVSQAMREFDKSEPQREDVYRHMEELSAAALQLHGLLVDRAGDITYAPAIQHGVSREPVVEAVVEDTLLKDHMWTLLERIFASLEWVGGDLGGSRDNLSDRLLQGIQASAR